MACPPWRRGALSAALGALGATGAHGATSAAAVSKLQAEEVSTDGRIAEEMEVFCQRLSALERAVDESGGLESPKAPWYEGAMREWRATWGTIGRHQPSCRVEALGASLCRLGERAPPVDAEAWGLTGQWASHMSTLAGRQRGARDCREFARFHENGWLPPLWRWAEATPGLGGAVLDAFLADPEYETVYARAAGDAPPFGSPAAELLLRPGGVRLTRKRAQELQHARVLRSAAGVDISALSVVVELGGGTGEMAAAYHDLGFRGRHLVIDLPPMVLLQRYWLRYSGLPAFMGEDTPGLPQRPGIVLETSLAPDLMGRHLAGADPRKSLFVGLWSFTEAGLAARERLWPLLLACGTVLLAFGDVFDGINNSAYLASEFERRGLAGTHALLAWNVAGSSGYYYLLARRRDLGAPRCLESMNCRNSTRHPLLSPP